MDGHGGTLRPAAFHILLALASGELHGLGIAEAIEDATDGELRVGPGTLYRTLKELHVAAYIEEAELGEDEDPRRRPYRLTPSGRRRLRAEAGRLQRIVQVARRRDVLAETP